LNPDDLNNFKSDATVQQWEGEDFRSGVSISPMFIQKCAYLKTVFNPKAKKSLNFNLLLLSKHERKINYSVDSYFKDTLRAGRPKTEKPLKSP